MAEVNVYKLVTGIHVGKDMSIEPDENGEHPVKTFNEGDLVHSDRDLVASCGETKFQLVSGTSPGATRSRNAPSQTRDESLPGDPAPAQKPTEFPNKQVGTGLQATTGTPAGNPTGGTGMMTKETAPEPEEQSPKSKDALSPVQEGLKAAGALPAEQDAKKADAQKGQAQQPNPNPKSAPAPKKALPDNLDRMNTNELKSFAADEEIDLKGASNKNDMLKAIRQARA